MCGIAGVVTPHLRAVPDAALRAAQAAIRYRGRDAEGIWSDDRNVVLAHSRLAVVDPVLGAQPMQDASKRFVVTFGGEIHNYPELRSLYGSMGAQFRTGSDTEVLLEGYRLKGAEVCDDLVGMFAFAIWDATERKLFLARDRLGEKPLYWFAGKDAWWFGSSCAAFAGAPGWTGALSERGLAEYAAAGSMHGETTIFEQAVAVPPGSSVTIKPGEEPRRRQWWSLKFGTLESGSRERLAEEYEATLSEAVRVRLRSDVPIGLTFSGGVDSGTIAAIAGREGRRLPCYTFDHDTLERPSPETARAQAVAARLSLPWHLTNYDYKADFTSDLIQAYRYFDQPSWQPELLHVHQVSRSIRAAAVVGLTGSGADEILLGYSGDHRLRQLELARRVLPRGPTTPEAVLRRRLLRAAAKGPLPDLGQALEPSLEAWAEQRRSTGARRAWDVRTHYSLTWGNVEALYRAPDIAGLAAGVELRSPFLDHRVVEFAVRLPVEAKLPSHWTSARNKWVARETYSRLIGADLAWQGKLNMGANVRWDLDLGTPELRDFVEDGLSALDENGLDSRSGRVAWDAYRTSVTRGDGPADYTIAMRALMLGLWFRHGSLGPPA